MKKWLLALPLFLTAPAVLAEVPVFELIIKDNHFHPQTLEVPAGRKVKLLVKNQDPGPEEFESYPLNREKIITGNSSGVIYIGPLEAGEYDFFGDFHQDTAKGRLIAK